MERRSHEREAIEPVEMVIESIEGNGTVYSNVPILIEDVSLSGIRFRCHVPFRQNDVIILALPSLSIAEFLRGRIAWREEADASLFVYGLDLRSKESS